jgi:hypothetical protein
LQAAPQPPSLLCPLCSLSTAPAQRASHRRYQACSTEPTARPALRPGAHAATPPRRVPHSSRAAERPAPRAPQAGSTPLCPDVKIRPATRRPRAPKPPANRASARARPSCARPPSSRQAVLLPPPAALLPPPAAESALLPPPAAESALLPPPVVLLPPAARARPGQADQRQSVLKSSPAQPRPVPATTAVLQPQQPLPRGHPAVPRSIPSPR